MLCYLNVGYPLGYTKGHSPYSADRRFAVESGDEITEISGDELKVWLGAVCGKEKNEIMEAGGITASEFEYAAERLTKKKLLIELDTEDLSALGELVFLRQGIGIGCHEKENVYQISVGQNAYIGEEAFEIWKLSNGKRTFSELNDMLTAETKGKSVYELCAALAAKGYILAVQIVK